MKKMGRADSRKFIGKRVRSAIRDSAPQLRRCRDTAFPEVLLLYDNIEVDGYWPFGRNDHLQPLDIGGWNVWFSFSAILARSRLEAHRRDGLNSWRRPEIERFL